LLRRAPWSRCSGCMGAHASGAAMAVRG
jgi:hypothetical protein